MALSKQPDVFEMILHSVGDDSTVAHATPHRDRPEVWHTPRQEGQLAVDVADNGSNVIVVSTMAGAESDSIEVYIHNDLLTIRGVRHRPVAAEGVQYFHEECFWGPFSRTIVLPVEVDGYHAKAEYRQGVITISIPKRRVDKKIQVTVVDE